MTSSRAELGQAGLKGLGASCRGEVGPAPCGAGALGAGFCSALSRRGLCPLQARVLAG